MLQPADTTREMTVQAWHQDFLLDLLRKQEAGERVDELIYLVDISIPHLAHTKLRAAIPILRDCDETGELTLNHYVDLLHGRDIGMPEVQAQLYLSPPTNGGILTPTHYDGHGSQASVHAVLFGGASNFNLVHTYPGERSPKQEAAFRRVLQIAPVGQSQYLPHQQTMQFTAGKETWDVTQLRRYQELGLPAASVHKLHPGEVMLLPTGLAHNFKKVQDPPEYAATPDRSPMLGYAGDSSYVGATSDSVLSNCAAMSAAAAEHRRVKDPPLCFLITGVISMCMWIAELSTATAVQREQVRGALPTLHSYVQLERRVLSRLGFTEATEESISVVDVSDAANGVKGESEWVCSSCQGEVPNLHGVQKNAAHPAYLCAYCLDSSPSSFKAPLSFRFYPTTKLEDVVSACTSLADGQSDSSEQQADSPLDESRELAYEECEAQVKLLEGLLPEGALLTSKRYQRRKCPNPRKASFHREWIYKESKLYLGELRSLIKSAVMTKLAAQESTNPLRPTEGSNKRRKRDQ